MKTTKLDVFNKVKKKSNVILEDTARCAGLLLAHAEGFGLRLRLILPFGVLKKISTLICFDYLLASSLVWSGKLVM